nr:MAG TPA: Major tail protein [Caudoviricetes sp.]
MIIKIHYILQMHQHNKMPSVNITKVYLLDVPLENDYKNTLYFANASAQQTYFQSRIIGSYSYNDFSYQRKDQIIRIPEHYDNIYKCNYVMYQNSAYNNKWFYAFVTDLEYINDGRTDLHIETDVIQTWLFDYTVKSSFVEREHVSNDTVGLHTVPENLELGEYINQAVPLSETVDINFLQTTGTHKNYVVLAVSQTGLDSAQPTPDYNGVFGGLTYLVFPTFADCRGYINHVQSQFSDDNIVSAFMVPYELGIQGNDFQWLNYQNFTFGYIMPKNTPTSLRSVEIAKPTVLDSNYSPRNKKLLTFPYVFLNITNNGGSYANYMYEYFTNINGSTRNTCPFVIEGSIGVGCSIKLIPIHYKYGDSALNTNEYNYSESLDACKLPTCSWTNDAYTNWLTQNAINIPLQAISDIASIGVGAYTGNVGVAISGASGIANTLSQVYAHSKMPDTAKGGVNQGDYTFAKQISYSIYKRSIKKEYAQIIDKYFDMYGYKVNMVKVPNKNHRSKYWYTKTINVNINGDIPQSDMQKIKSCYDNGITFWRNASEIEDYSVNNPIV